MNDSAPTPTPTRPGPQISRLFFLVLVLFAVWFVAAYLYKAGSTTLFFDSAWHGSVAKNLAQGPGYASSYDGYQFFDPDVTTGPAPIGLLAAAIAVFGNPYSLPLYVASVLHLALFAAVVIGFARLDGWRSASIFALTFALLQTYFEPRWWQIFTGDMSALLWGIAGLQMAVCAVTRNRYSDLFIAGALLGLSLLTKSVGLMFTAAAVVYILYTGLGAPRTLLRALPALTLGLIICLLPWQLYKAAAEHPQEDIGRPVASSALARNVVGIVQLWEAPDKRAHLKKSLNMSHALLQQKLGKYGAPQYSHLGLILVSVLLLLYSALRPRGQRNHLLLALSLATAAYWFWYMVLCVSYEKKYTLYPLLMSMLLLLYWLSTTRLRWAAPALVLSWALLGSASARDDMFRFYTFSWDDDLYRSNLLAVAKEVEKLSAGRAAGSLAACGWLGMPWPLEYVLPRSGYFKNCYRQLATAMEQDPASGVYRWREDADLEFVLVVDEMLWAFDRLNSDKNQVILALCGKNQLYRNDYFRILHCRDTDLRNGITPGPDSPFLEMRRPG